MLMSRTAFFVYGIKWGIANATACMHKDAVIDKNLIIPQKTKPPDASYLLGFQYKYASFALSQIYEKR